MPARRELTMQQLRQMLRLHHDGVSAREIGRTLGVARSTIQDNLERARVAGISWPLPAEWTDEFVEQRLFVRAGVKPGRRRHTEPDWAALARELKRSGVNLMVLWEEYRESHPDGYGYSRFCDLYREFERRLSPVMRQHHVAGDKMFVDYSGKKIAIVDPSTGEVRDAEIFVAVLGASNYTYAEATWTQTLPDWILSRSDLFASIERVALRSLPATDYEFAEWRLARVGLDYHIEVDGFYYSVPHALIRAQVGVRITSRTIEVFHRAKRVAAHQIRNVFGTRSMPISAPSTPWLPGGRRRDVKSTELAGLSAYVG